MAAIKTLKRDTWKRVVYCGHSIKQTRQMGERYREAGFRIGTLTCGKFAVTASIQVEVDFYLARIMCYGFRH